MITRGDVVLVYIPYLEGGGQGKRRPVLVVQNDGHNQKLPHTIVAAITSQLRNLTDPTVYLLDPEDSEGQAAGLPKKSLIRCDRLFTIDKSSIGPKMGHLAHGTMDRVDDWLHASLGLPPQAQPSFGDYEKWPGFLKLRERLQVFTEVLAINATGQAFLDIDIQPTKNGLIHQIWANDLQLILPAKKQEFEETGHSIRLTFRVSDEDMVAKLKELAPIDLERHPIYRATLWAYSGHSNRITCVYTGQRLNEGSREVYLMSMSEGVFEIGFDASGNLFDALLMSPQLKVTERAVDAPVREVDRPKPDET